MVSIHRPHTLIELAMARSLLAAHDIPYFVHNGGYASLYPGMQIGLLNVPTIMVPPSAAQFAEELLRAYLEAMACVWFVRRIGSVQAPKES